MSQNLKSTLTNLTKQLESARSAREKLSQQLAAVSEQVVRLEGAVEALNIVESQDAASAKAEAEKAASDSEKSPTMATEGSA